MESQTNAETIALSGKLLEFRNALESEINTIKKSGQSSTLLSSGKKIRSSGEEYFYGFNVDYLPSIPADTPCKLIIEKNSYDVTVVSFDESEIIICSSVELPDNMSTARLENGTTVLIERLIKRIEINSVKDNPAGNRMLPDEGFSSAFSQIFPLENLEYSNNSTDSQRKAVNSALTNNITYIWGPPGTGKTTVIGDIILNLFRNHRSVLIVSHTNIAVDGAIEKITKKIQKREDGTYPVLRLGIPQKDLDEEVILDNHIKAIGEDLYNRREEIVKKQDHYRKQRDESRLLLEKYYWTEAFDINEIRKAIAKEEEIRERVYSINKDLEAKKAIKSQFLKDHPDIKEYEEYKNQERILEKKSFDTLQLLRGIDSEISDLEGRIDRSQEEIIKHQVYKSLSIQVSKIMPEEFLMAKIAEYESGISALKQESQNILYREKELNEKIVLGQRNAITSFVSKKSIESAQAELLSIANKKRELDNSINAHERTIESYQNQIVELRSLKNQMNDVSPSESMDYWLDEKEKLDKRLKGVKQTRIEASKKHADTLTLLSECRAKLSLAKEIQSEYKAIIDSIDKIKGEVESVNGIYHKSFTESDGLLGIAKNKGRRFLPDEMDSIKDHKATFESLMTFYDEIILLFNDIKLDDVENALRESNIILRELSNELQVLEEKIENLRREAVNRADIIGATLAKSYLDNLLQERKFDTVILDEASMASIPALWCASYLAERNIVVVGDFLQLPPIVMSKEDVALKWLGRDIFAASGMQEKAKNDYNPKPQNFIMLNDQFRMESEIADVANMYYGEYGGLNSHDELENRIKAREAFFSWYPGDRRNRSVEVVDTSELHAWVTSVPQGKSHSRLNCFSAALCVEMAFSYVINYVKKAEEEDTSVEGTKVIIVAPYRPHVDRVRQLIDIGTRSYGLSKYPGLIKAGTIHSFQGTEADIVIFDLVIDEPHWKANLFMTDKVVNDELRKMFNVAVTRAKFKLFVVGNIPYCVKRSKNNALHELLNKLINEDKFTVYNAKEMFPRLIVSIPRTFKGEALSEDSIFWCQEGDFYDYLFEDIRNFKTRMVIFSPFLTENRISMILPELSDSIKIGREIIVVTRPLSDRNKGEITHYKKCEQELSDIGVTVIHKKMMHEKLIILDDYIVWNGSLNSLSNTGSTGELMQRTCNHQIAVDMEEYYGVSGLESAIEAHYELFCPICHGQMIIGESDKGGIYWKCPECNYTRDIKQQYPIDGVMRCHCGGTYSFVMKNQPRWVCNENPKHYQIVKKADLRLEKMASLIKSKDDRVAVDAYFESKAKEKDEHTNYESAFKTENTPNPIGETIQLSFADLGLM